MGAVKGPCWGFFLVLSSYNGEHKRLRQRETCGVTVAQSLKPSTILPQ